MFRFTRWIPAYYTMISFVEYRTVKNNHLESCDLHITIFPLYLQIHIHHTCSSDVETHRQRWQCPPLQSEKNNELCPFFGICNVCLCSSSAYDYFAPTLWRSYFARNKWHQYFFLLYSDPWCFNAKPSDRFCSNTHHFKIAASWPKPSATAAEIPTSDWLTFQKTERRILSFLWQHLLHFSALNPTNLHIAWTVSLFRAAQVRLHSMEHREQNSYRHWSRSISCWVSHTLLTWPQRDQAYFTAFCFSTFIEKFEFTFYLYLLCYVSKLLSRRGSSSLISRTRS